MADRPSPQSIRLVVRRGAVRRFERLQRKSVDLPVVICWDRREGDRRRAARGADRRKYPPATWELADFVVVIDRN